VRAEGSWSPVTRVVERVEGRLTGPGRTAAAC
jgi:hypothetical protein